MNLGFIRAALVLAAVAAPAQATDRQVYSVSIAGIPTGQMQMAVNTNENAYSAQAVVQATGLVGALFKFRFDGTAQGRLLNNGGLQPISYSAFRESGDSPQRVEIAYRSGTPTSVAIDPARKPAPHNLEPTAQQGTIDPVSATLTFLTPRPPGQACGRSARIYDGSRLFSLQISPRQASGNLYACAGRYTRIGGFPPRLMAERTEFPFTLFFEERDGLMQPVRVVVDTTFGRAVANRTR